MSGRLRLQVALLEDRLVPSAVFAPDRLIVHFPSSEEAESTLRGLPVVESVRSLGYGQYRVDLTSGTSLDDGERLLESLPGVLSANWDRKIEALALPNDPSYSSQWAYATPGINAPAAWSVATGTARTIVGVVDTGIDYRHPDLAANIWTNTSSTTDRYGADFINGDNDPFDDNGHGTHVAGIIGAVGNNSVGVTGVDWNTRIMALKFMGADGGGFTSDAIAAINYGVAHGAKILNNSWGGADDPALLTAIQNARSAGVIIVAAAGNNGVDIDANPFYPASYSTQLDNVVVVTAIDASGNLPIFSDTGLKSVLLAAPGADILSTLPGNQYGRMSGTSMAAPIVSGALALLWDAHPTWTYSQIISKLKSSVTTVPSLVGKTITGGKLDLAKLLDAPAVPPTSPPVVIAGPSVVSASFSGAKTGTFDRVTLVFNSAIDVTTLSGITITGPSGAIRVSAAIPVVGSGNQRFTLMFSQTQTASGTYSVIVGSGVKDSQGVSLDQNGNGILGETADLFQLSATIAGPAPTVVPPTVPPPPAAPRDWSLASTGSPVPIQDRRTTRVDLSVANDFLVTGLTVSLDITHARMADLVIRLVAPDGRSAILFNRRAGINLIGTTFSDSATTSLTTAVAPFRGLLKPEQALALFKGARSLGVWSLQVFDLADGVTGSIGSVRLTFASAQPASIAGFVPRSELFALPSPHEERDMLGLLSRFRNRPHLDLESPHRRGDTPQDARETVRRLLGQEPKADHDEIDFDLELVSALHD